MLFWLAFAIFIVGLFLFNREAISRSIQTIQKEITVRKNPGTETPLPIPEENTPPASPSVSAPAAQPPQAQKPAPSKTPAPSASQGNPPPAPPPAPQQSPASSKPASNPAKTQPVPPPVQPAAQMPPQSAPQAGQSPQAAQGPAEQRDRTLYFIQVDRGGSILRVKVNRRLPVSDSPMTDVIQALITGPNGDETGKGLISLIPPATRILYATVRGDTAYINFSEDFQYNTYGVEGYAGQLRQIVFTATEFPNVRYVQILVEGRRLDYLGEGIWIGSPINRDML